MEYRRTSVDQGETHIIDEWDVHAEGIEPKSTQPEQVDGIN